MSDTLGMEYEEAFYHVMNGGRGRQRVFHNAAYYEGFLCCLEEAHAHLGAGIHAYCPLGDHYHLLLKAPQVNLSRIVRHICGVHPAA